METKHLIEKPSATQDANKLERAGDFKHSLWRLRPRADALHGGLPELLATDGANVRRLQCQPRQLIFQAFQDAPTARSLIQRVESCVEPGVALVGYSMFEERGAVSILHTGQDLGPGWLAFPDQRPLLEEGGRYDTLPLDVDERPRLRLIAGAHVLWERRELVVAGALEQRGSRFASGPHAFHLLEHLTHWRLEAISYKRGERRRVELAKTGEPRGAVRKVSPQRVEASFVIEPMIYQQLAQLQARAWFELRFDRELFCLPREWATFWLSVDLSGSPGLLS